MTTLSHHRGHSIYCENGVWFYSDTRTPTMGDVRLSCSLCGLKRTKEDHDRCLGVLPGVMNACCGHGQVDEAYIQFWNEDRISGKKAREWGSVASGLIQRIDRERGEG